MTNYLKQIHLHLADLFHWCFIVFMGVFAWAVEHQNYIVGTLAILAALMQVYIQRLRIKYLKEKNK